MYVLKYGNLDSQSALGKGNTSGSNYDKPTGETNGKGIDFGNTSDTTKVRFQWVEDFFGTKSQWCDGVRSGSNKIWTTTNNFNNNNTGYYSYGGFSVNKNFRIKRVIGDSEIGFIPRSDGGSSSTYYCDYGSLMPDYDRIAYIGGYAGVGADAGAFFFRVDYTMSGSNSNIGARLMFL